VPDPCLSCEQNAQVGEDRDDQCWIAADEHWRAGHAIGSKIAGWLVLVPRRHVTTIAELTDEEAATLGLWQVRLSRALHTVTGCAKTYVAQFAELQGFEHVHFHVVPRPSGFPREFCGPRVFNLLGDADQPPVNDDEVDVVTAALRTLLTSQS
jgi:diadenosine tetraphosphate (Ap4A) HIT family hydrolase